jgi:hypothetical protein
MSTSTPPAGHLLTQLIALSRNAHQNLGLDDPADYWYRLGQRNAYAHAAGLTLAQGVDDVAFAAADRLTAALTDGTTELGALQAAAVRTGTPVGHETGGPPDVLAWIGPQAFAARYGDVPGIDQDFGMRWGKRGDQRISLRRAPGAKHGLLYAFDPTWEEYAVLMPSVDLDAVEAAFTRALQIDIHMGAADFAELVACHRLLPAPDAVRASLRVEL